MQCRSSAACTAAHPCQTSCHPEPCLRSRRCPPAQQPAPAGWLSTVWATVTTATDGSMHALMKLRTPQPHLPGPVDHHEACTHALPTYGPGFADDIHMWPADELEVFRCASDLPKIFQETACNASPQTHALVDNAEHLCGCTCKLQ